jgi:hypothetical protein
MRARMNGARQTFFLKDMNLDYAVNYVLFEETPVKTSRTVEHSICQNHTTPDFI